MRRLFPTIMTVGLAAAVLLFTATGCDDKTGTQPGSVPAAGNGAANKPDYLADRRADGERAFRAGVPSTANPYVGATNHVSWSKAWLDGWIEAKEKAEKK